MDTKIYSKALLILPLESLYDASYAENLRPPTSFAAHRTTNHLRILAFCTQFGSSGELKPTHAWKELQSLLTLLYAEATGVSQEKDNVLMNIEVVLHDPSLPDELGRHSDVEWECLFVPEYAESTLPLGPLSSLQRTVIPGSAQPSAPNASSSCAQEAGFPPTYPVVALGGTFDHLHAGHKILLSMSAWISSRKVIVGVTDDALLVKKSNREVLEPLPDRIQSVTSFLKLFKPQLEYQIVPISDVYGPTATDPDIQALVVSKETLSGASAVNKKREELSFPTLTHFVIDVVSPSATLLTSDDAEYLKNAKMSSTFIRQWIVDQKQKENAPPPPAPATQQENKEIDTQRTSRPPSPARPAQNAPKKLKTKSKKRLFSWCSCF